MSAPVKPRKVTVNQHLAIIEEERYIYFNKRTGAPSNGGGYLVDEVVRILNDESLTDDEAIEALTNKISACRGNLDVNPRYSAIKFIIAAGRGMLN